MNNETDMVLTIKLDYRKVWDRSAAEILRKVKSWDYETVKKMEAVVNDVNTKYWERKNKEGKKENSDFPEMEL